MIRPDVPAVARIVHTPCALRESTAILPPHADEIGINLVIIIFVQIEVVIVVIITIPVSTYLVTIMKQDLMKLLTKNVKKSEIQIKTAYLYKNNASIIGLV